MRRLTRPGSDASGQMSLDFLIGVVLFLMAFVFVFMYVSDMMMPFQSNSDELTMTADRIGTECVENILLDDPAMPNVVSDSRIAGMEAELNKYSLNPSAYQAYCENILGAFSNRPYDVNIEIKWVNGTTVHYGPADPAGSLNVGQSKRIVAKKGTGTLGTLRVTVW